MKNNIKKHRLGKLESFLDDELGKIELSKEEWEYMEKAYTHNYKKVMFGLGIGGSILFVLDLCKKYIITFATKLFTAKGAIAVATTISLSSGAYFGYKYFKKTLPDSTVISKKKHKTVEEPKSEVEENKFIHKKINNAKPKYTPHVGIMYFKARGEGKALSRLLTKSIAKNLSIKKFKLLNKPEDGQGLINILITGDVAKIDNKYVVTVKATNLKHEFVFNQIYRFDNTSQINTISQKIARELTNANF